MQVHNACKLAGESCFVENFTASFDKLNVFLAPYLLVAECWQLNFELDFISSLLI